MYLYSIARFREIIGRTFWKVAGNEVNLEEIDVKLLVFEENHSTRYKMAAHLMWMLSQIEKSDDPIKSARWIAWSGDRLEMMGLMTNKEHRDVIRTDEQFDRVGRNKLK